MRAIGIGCALVIQLWAATMVPDPALPHDSQVGPSPGVRNAHAFVYDPDRRRAVLFGGADDHRVVGDTWSWHSATHQWRVLTEKGPEPRTFPAMAYDKARREMVVFGGNRVLFGSPENPAVFLSDTWVLQGTTWNQRKVAGPSPRAEAGIAYDESRRRVVLFGGYQRVANNTERFGDTWEWDGRTWMQAATIGPSARNGATMAYDARARRIFLFGGRGATNDTWTWDGREWIRQHLPDVPGRFNPAMTYDSARRSLVRFGGWDGTTRTADTWLFTGTGVRYRSMVHRSATIRR